MADKREEEPSHLRYRRARFSTRLPTDRLYARSHVWLRQEESGAWRIGHTKFAMRMLGEPVEIGIEVGAGDVLERGQIIGWLEGFKAVTDLYSPMGGRFRRSNPALEEGIQALKSHPYDAGWLYEIDGQPGDDLVDATGYAAFLDGTIDEAMGRDLK